MITIKELAPKPSDAIDAMVQGLKDYKKHGIKKVNMNTYLSADDKFCYGCAALATVCNLKNIDLKTKHALIKGGGGRVVSYPPAALADDKYGPERTIGWRVRVSKVYDCETSDEKREIHLFENAIDSLRCGYVAEFLSYYNVKDKDMTRLHDKIGPLIKDNYLSNTHWEDHLDAYTEASEMLREEGY